MRVTQDKVIAKLKSIAAEEGVEANLVVSGSNCGELHFKKNLTTLANVRFIFEESHAAMAVAKGGKQAQYLADDNKTFYVSSGDGAGWGFLFKCVRSMLYSASREEIA